MNGITASGSEVKMDPTGADLTLSGFVVAPTNATIFSALSSAALRNGQVANDMLLSRLGSRCVMVAGACPSEGGSAYRAGGAWVQAAGDTAKTGGNAAAPGFTDNSYGVLGGFDRRLGDTTLGVAVGYQHVDVSENGTGSRATLDTVRLAGYGAQWLGPVNLAGTVGVAYDFMTTQRSFPGFGGAKGDGKGHEFNAALQADLPMTVGPVTVTPRIGARYHAFYSQAFREEGETSQNLNVGKQDFRSLQPFVGLSVGYDFATASQRAAQVEARVSYAYETLSVDRSVSVNSMDGTGFVVQGATPTRGMLSVGVGARLPLGKRLDLNVNYDRVIRTGNDSAQAVKFDVRYRF